MDQQPSNENHAVVVVEQSKGRTTSSSGWWIVLQQVVLASTGWSLLGMLAFHRIPLLTSQHILQISSSNAISS
jgi:hypothetical protein